MTTGRGHF